MTTHVVFVPEHPPPDQPANVDPDAELSVNVTWEPELKLAEHVDPQSIPDGLLDTEPDPEPDFDTVSVFVGGGDVVLKVAVTL